MATMTGAETAMSESVASFDGFFDMHYERLLRTMYLATGDRHEAEDLAQDAFVRVYERWDRVGRMDDPVGYLYRTALNLRRSRLRRLAVAARRLRGGRGEEPPDPAVATTEADAVRRALASLPPEIGRAHV
jgi:RNA polymerase sigma-70 factor (ECF subfamily)